MPFKLGEKGGEKGGEMGGFIMAETEKVGEKLGRDHSPVVCHKETVRGSLVAHCSQCS